MSIDSVYDPMLHLNKGHSLSTYEWLTIAAIVVGPLSAVIITLIVEHRRSRRDAKRTILQTLLTTRGRYADPAYSWAIRAARLEFARSAAVIRALDEYLNQVRIKPAADGAEDHHRESERREGLLLSEMLKDLGYVGLTSQQIEAYTAQGLADRDRLLQVALEALPHLAISAKRSADAAEAMLAKLPTPSE